MLVAGLGHAVLVAVQRWATWVFGALNIVVGGFLVATVDWAAVAAAAPAPSGAVVAAVGVIAAGTGIGWANASADMSRYQSPSVRAGSLVASAAAGAGIPLVLLISLGSLLAAGATVSAQVFQNSGAALNALGQTFGGAGPIYSSAAIIREAN